MSNNRQIKFRAWDGEKILDDVPPSAVPLGANGVIMGTTCKVMQFTGLLDKNGKEIYEGDIIKGGKFDWNWQVIYSYGGFILDYQENGIGTFLPIIGATEMEIIGNIYESPELPPNPSLLKK